MEILVPRFEANEIAKGSDFDYINDREYANLCTIFEELFSRSTNDMIVGGLTCQQRGTPSMNVDLSIGLGYCKSTGKVAHTGSLFGPVAIANGGAQNRIDLIEVRLKETDYDQQQRAFKDPVTGAISYQDVDTKTRFTLEAQIVQGVEGAGVAQSHTSGWIKVAEIAVDAGESTSILDADIENCTGGYDTEVTTNWTAETAVTFRVGSLADFKDVFRAAHKEDGSHTDNIIGDAAIDWGSGAGQVSAADLPIVDGGSKYVGTEAETALQEAATLAELISTANGKGASLLGIEDAAGRITATQLEAALAEIPTFAELLSVAAAKGASLIGIQDAGSRITAVNVEAALQEIVGTGRTTETIKGNADEIAGTGSFEVTIQETIAKGDLMGIVGNDSAAKVGTAALDDQQFTTNAYQRAKVRALGDNRFIVHWTQETVNRNKYVRIGEYNHSTKTISWLTSQVLVKAMTTPTPGIMMVAAAYEGADKGVFCCVYQIDPNTTYDLYAKFGEYNGAGGVTWLTSETKLNGALAMERMQMTWLLTGSRMMMITEEKTGGHLNATVFEESGGSVSIIAGPTRIVASGAATVFGAICSTGVADYFCVQYITFGTNTMYGRIGHYAASAINWDTAQFAVDANAHDNAGSSNIDWLRPNIILFAWSEDATFDAEIRIGKFTGSGISWLTSAVEVDSTFETSQISITALGDVRHFVVSSSNSAGSGYPVYKVGMYENGVITWKSPMTTIVSIGFELRNCLLIGDGGNMAWITALSSSGLSDLRVYANQFATYAGVATEAGGATDVIHIQSKGIGISLFTGLTAGREYYADESTATLTDDVDDDYVTKLVGTAINATDLIFD